MHKCAGYIANSYKQIVSYVRTYIHTKLRIIATLHVTSHTFFLDLRTILSKNAINTAHISSLMHDTLVKPRA